jgi:DNA-binding protein HU-beta
MRINYCIGGKKRPIHFMARGVGKMNNNITKADLVDKMAQDAGITKVAAADALNSFMDTVTKTLKKKDGKVTLVGFGTFSKMRRKARQGRNPQTGEPIKIKACNVVKFKPGKKLRDAV